MFVKHFQFKILSMYQKIIAGTIAALLCFGVIAQQPMKDLIAENMELAIQQYKLLATKTPADSMPRHYDPRLQKWVNSDTKWWCSGFFPGSLWLIYEYTKDGSIRKEAEKRLSIL